MTEQSDKIALENVLPVKPIGIVHNAVHGIEFTEWDEVVSRIVIRSDLRDGLRGIEHFSHVTVIYYLHLTRFSVDRELVRHPFRRPDLPLLGVFARRAKERPNPIGLSTVPIVRVGEGTVEVEGLDAVDGTPVLDIKPYNPVYDHAEGACVPDWVTRHEDLY